MPTNNTNNSPTSVHDVMAATVNSHENMHGVASVTVTSSGGLGCTNTVKLHNSYSILLNVGTYQRNERTNNLSHYGAGKLPYALVYTCFDHPDQWQIIKTGTTTGGILVPIEKIGDYRLYIKEPLVVFKVGDSFKIPYHMKTDGTASTHEVQPFFAMKVESQNSSRDNTSKALTPPLTITTYLPNGLNRAASHYPTMGQTVTVTDKSASRLTFGNQFISKVNSAKENNYRITEQLWADCCQVYGYLHRLIQHSSYKDALEKIYQARLTHVNVHGRKLTLHTNGGKNSHTIEFPEDGTKGARLTFSYENQNFMRADEAIRRIHPSVWDYWFDVMEEQKITYNRLGSGWRPHLGSTFHRYSLALDFNDTHAIMAVDNPKYHSVDDPRLTIDKEVKMTFKTVAQGAQYNFNPMQTVTAQMLEDQKNGIALAKKILNRIAQDRSRLGWLGGPWQLKLSDVGLTGNTVFLNTNEAHKHHVHLTVGTEQV